MNRIKQMQPLIPSSGTKHTARFAGALVLVLFAGLLVRSVAAIQETGQPPVHIQSVDHSTHGVITLRWTGGEGPFAVEKIDPLPFGVWQRELITTWKNASVPLDSASAFYRIHDLGQSSTNEYAWLDSRLDELFLDDLSALVRIPTYRDPSTNNEAAVLANLQSIQNHLNKRVAAFNAGQASLRILPFDWRAEIESTARWVFGFRVGTGLRKLALLTHLDTVPPGDPAWNPFEPRLEVRSYRGGKQTFLVGRGSIDDKGPSIIALSVLEAVARRYDGNSALTNWTIEVAFDTNEENDLNIPAYFDAVGSPELGIVFDAIWTIRAEKGIERPVFRVPLGPTANVETTNLTILSFETSAGSVNQIPNHAIARIAGPAPALEAFARDVSRRYETHAFDDPAYRRAPLEVTREGPLVLLTTSVQGAQHGSAPEENRALGANPLVSLGNFLAGLVQDGTLAPNSYGRLAQFMAWAWGTQVFGGKHPDLLQRSDDVFQAGNGTTYALTKVAADASGVALSLDIRYAQGHQSAPWNGATDGLLSGSSTFPQVFSNLAQNFNALYPDAQLSFETRNISAPDIRNPESPRFRHIRDAYQEVMGTPCPLVATGGGTDAKGATNLIAAGSIFSPDLGPPLNLHGDNEGAPVADLRLSARILWQVLQRQIGDPPVELREAWRAR